MFGGRGNLKNRQASAELPKGIVVEELARIRG